MQHAIVSTAITLNLRIWYTSVWYVLQQFTKDPSTGTLLQR